MFWWKDFGSISLDRCFVGLMCWFCWFCWFLGPNNEVKSRVIEEGTSEHFRHRIIGRDAAEKDLSKCHQLQRSHLTHLALPIWPKTEHRKHVWKPVVWLLQFFFEKWKWTFKVERSSNSLGWTREPGHRKEWLADVNENPLFFATLEVKRLSFKHS